MQGSKQKVMHLAAFTKAHLVFGGMHIHIHAFGIQFQIQNKRSMAAVVHHVLIGLAHGMIHHAIFHAAPIDEEILQIGLTAGKGRQPQPSPQAQLPQLGIHSNGIFYEVGTTEGGNPTVLFCLSSSRLERMHGTLIVTQAETHLKMTQRQALDHFFQMAEFGFFRTQELAPGRGIEEQIAHFHRRPLRMGCGHDHRFHITAFCLHRPARPTVIRT